MSSSDSSFSVASTIVSINILKPCWWDKLTLLLSFLLRLLSSGSTASSSTTGRGGSGATTRTEVGQ